MNPPPPPEVLAFADSLGWEACEEKGRCERRVSGQFFTPPQIARFLAHWFHETSFNRPKVHLLDPGAGAGALTAAVVDRIITLHHSGALPRLREVILEVWELDADFLPALRDTLLRCKNSLENAGIQVRLQIFEGNFIEGAFEDLQEGLFSQAHETSITHAILNPPYRKISSGSRERTLLGALGMETSNLYAAFVWIAIRRLIIGGELTAITPRSFCNGPYFREFRRDLLSSSIFHTAHLFNSRTEAFGRDAVLQENLLFHLTKGSPNRTEVILSSGSLDRPDEVAVPFDRFVRTDDPEQVIHLAAEADAQAIGDFIRSLPCELADLGITVSTGPVVDFRVKNSLSQHLRKGDAPLLYPHSVKAGKVIPPFSDSSLHNDRRNAKKPVAIAINDESLPWLVPASRFVLIKRFSSKEERRRLVAGVMEPNEEFSGLIGIENHLNFFHRNRQGLPQYLARGLARFLNSTVADRYFRQFNGHTQVNVSDLRAFRYPSAAILEKLGKTKIDDGDQRAIDLAMTRQLGAPSFPSP